MDERNALAAWMAGYIKAWNSNAPDDIAALFTDDAEYLTEPYAEPWRGRDEIVRGWLKVKDEPGDAEFSWEVLIVSPELAAIEGEAIYREPPRTYSNLWVIQLAGDGRCRRFTEWWMKHPD